MNKKCRLVWFIFNQSNICCNNTVFRLVANLSRMGKCVWVEMCSRSFGYPCWHKSVRTSDVRAKDASPALPAKLWQFETKDSTRTNIKLVKKSRLNFCLSQEIILIASKTETFEFAFRSKNLNLNPEWKSSSEVAFAQFIQPSRVRIPQQITLFRESSPWSLIKVCFPCPLTWAFALTA